MGSSLPMNWYLRLFGVQIMALLLAVVLIFLIVAGLLWLGFKIL